MNPFRRLFDRLELRRAHKIARKLRRYIRPGEHVLDVGCGPLVVADELQKLTGARVLGIETLDYRKRPLPMALYSGARAPFRDASFDVVVIGFVLHHCDDGGLAVLREARRLTRGRILLLEDSFDTLFDRAAIRIVDKLLNYIENPAIPVPYRFRPSWDWKSLFGELGLTMTKMERLRTTPILKTRQILFVLESKGR